jgi:CubicO group peptidase (beta-lactamase class C family)
MSVTKQFTAAAIMLLVQDGRLSLDDPVSKYYPASPPAWQKVAIRHLLTHTSGIADYDPREGLRFQSFKDIVPVVSQRPTVFEAGANFSYNNAAYELLAVIIERISGQTFGDFLENRIFEPLGMRSTGLGPIPDDVVRGYRRTLDGVWERWDPIDLNLLGGAGGVYSTIDDMLAWSLALDSDDVLSRRSKSEMYADNGYNYGLGWRFATKYGRPLIWHTGNYYVAGFAAIFDRFPDDGITAVVMTNNTGLTNETATMMIGGQLTTFQANAARKLLERVEQLYFGRKP